MVDYSRPTMIYLDDGDPNKFSERFRACFCPNRELQHTHNIHHAHLPNMYIGDKMGELSTLRVSCVYCEWSVMYIMSQLCAS